MMDNAAKILCVPGQFFREVIRWRLPAPAPFVGTRGEKKETIHKVINGKIKEWKFANISYI